eukprot:CAMPEP_0184743020 /NCGR_PEP_ID=MMETSP0315-20130426/5920_1 /TAXON_ID=101924 /ORGANISM="Rhodosorus marinus, Strain UTEX LB 2760" /LENGTH=268 /DNA_ID=CAMNT_0027214107 /DNA_START=95 /DNA_END=901 /DNA_ORIENTATION=+
MKRVLTIAGSDSGGGAGIQADLKTFVANGVYGMTVVTALTAQNTTGTYGIHPIPIAFVRDQFNAVATDIGFDAVKTGMLANQWVIREVAGLLASCKPAHLVVDPVMVATSGSKLLEDDACSVLKSELLPLATLVTPNMPEASALLGREVVTNEDAKAAAYDLQKLIQSSGGSGAVLVKGGHAENPDASVDILYDGKEFQAFSAPRLNTRCTHGTGCTLASACAAWLARGESIPSAVEKAKQYVYEAMSNAEPLGKGQGPLNHGYLIKT